MTASHIALDHFFVPILIAWSLVDWLWMYPRFVRRIAEGVEGARKQLYYSILGLEWALTACVVAIWLRQQRPWAALYLSAPRTSGAAVGTAFAAGFLIVVWMQRRAVMTRPEVMDLVRRKIEHAQPLLPHTPDERRLFVLLSITAGVCEEILFRGFVIWYFALWTGPWLALVISSVIFGFGHIYQGVAQVPKTGLLGAALGAMVLLTGTLWPSIVIHTLIDMNSGDLGYRAFGAGRAAATDASGSAE